VQASHDLGTQAVFLLLIFQGVEKQVLGYKQGKLLNMLAKNQLRKITIQAMHLSLMRRRH
jgi:hypothetical protein